MRVTCPEGSPSTPIDLDFTATGGTQTTMIPGIFPQVCSVAETVTGGADPVAYQCDVVEAGGATNIPAECLSSTEFQTGVDGEITVTVTNTFPDEIPPDPAAPPPAAAAPAVAPAVAGTPTFTG